MRQFRLYIRITGILIFVLMNTNIILANDFNDNYYIRVLTYNIQSRPIIDRRPGKIEKLVAILRGYDVVIINEAFDKDVVQTLLALLKSSYPYQTNEFARIVSPKVNGGIYILSRWPFFTQGRRFFKNVCNEEDCAVDKGVAYVKIEIQNRNIHLFATHLQAGDSSERIRTRFRQLKIISDYVKSKRIPFSELVLIAGDLNVDKKKAFLYNLMLSTLKASPSVYTGLSKTKSSAYYDYILVANGSFSPLVKTNNAFKPRPNPSDHFPVKGYFSTLSVSLIVPIIGI